MLPCITGGSRACRPHGRISCVRRAQRRRRDSDYVEFDDDYGEPDSNFSLVTT